MRVALERLEKNRVSLEIEVDQEEVARALERAYRSVVKKVNIPGFRKGRVPRLVLEARLGKEALYESALEVLLPQAYQDALQQHALEPINQPEIDVVQMEDGKSLIFKATVEVVPEVKLGSYRGLEAVKPEVKVGDDEVEAQLKLLQQRHARLVDAGDGPVNDGETVVINVEATVDNKSEPRLGGQEKLVEVGAGKFLPGFEAHLLGMKVDEEKDISLHLPSLFQYADLEGKEAKFKTKIVAIKRKELSPIDDEFARDVSEFETIEELKEQLRNKMVEMGHLNAKRIFTERIVKNAVDQAEVEIPDILVHRQAEQDTEEFVRRLAFQRLNLEDYLRMANKDFETLRKEIEENAGESVKKRLVLGAIAKAEDIKVTPEELNTELDDLAAQYNMETEKLRQALVEKEQLGMIEQGILVDKVQKFLTEQAVEIPEQPKSDEEAAEAGTTAAVDTEESSENDPMPSGETEG